MLFYPGSAKYQRAVILLSGFACSFVGVNVVLGDFGTQKHVFSSMQAFVLPRVDEFFGVTSTEIEGRRLKQRAATGETK